MLHLFTFLSLLISFILIEKCILTKISLQQDNTTITNLTQLQKILPSDFWVDASNIILKTYNNSIVYCNENKEISFADKVIPDNRPSLFLTPISVNETFIQIQSKNNSYIGVDNSTGQILCNFKKEDKQTWLKPIRISNGTIFFRNYFGKSLLTDKRQPGKSKLFHPENYVFKRPRVVRNTTRRNNSNTRPNVLISISQETRNYSMDSNNTNISMPTPSIVTREFTKLHKLIPSLFWANKFRIILKTYDDKWVFCSDNLTITYADASRTRVGHNLYWKPILLNDAYIQLQSNRGSFIGFDNQTGKLTCNSKKKDYSNMLQPLKISDTKISFMNYNKKYLLTDKNHPEKSKYFYSNTKNMDDRRM
jgi:hypothetical protein